VEVAATLSLFDWWYARGDVAYTSTRLDEGDVPLAQAPRFVAKAATGVRFGGFGAELNLRHLGSRYATEERREPSLSDYTVFDFAARYRFGFLEVGLAVENITDTNWSSSEFYYESRPDPAGLASEDFHFSPGNPRNFRGWVTGYF
jgi:outer membrane cobalamin receptor